MGSAENLINGSRPHVQQVDPLLTEGSTLSLKKIGPWISEEESFKGVDGRRTDDRRTKADGKWSQ